MTRNEPEALARNGWASHEKCCCSGILKYKYRNPNYPGYEIEWWVKYAKFKIKNGASTRLAPTPISKMETTLQEL